MVESKTWELVLMTAPKTDLTDLQRRIQCQRIARHFITKGDICVEVGVLHGDHAAAILELEPGKLNLIDPWELDPSRHPRMDGIAGDDVFKNVSDRFGRDGRVEIFRMDSKEGSQQFDDLSLDWVYIDANHSWHHVSLDLRLWSRKVKVGGFLTGHDYLYPASDGTYPVHHAVDVFWNGNTAFKPVAFGNDWVLQRIR